MNAGCCLLVILSLAGAGVPDARPGPRFQERRRHEQVVAAERNDTVVVVNRFGNVQVSPGSSSEVKISAELIAGADSKACAESCLQRLTIKTERQVNRLVISSLADKVTCGATQFQANLTLTVPARASVRIENSYGDVAITGLQGRATVTNRFGNTSVDEGDFAGITNAFGDVSISGLAQGASVRNRFGNVNARNVSGALRISNETGTIRLAQSHGSAQVENRLGDIEVTDYEGSIEITSSEGPVVFRQTRTQADTVRINNRQGSIRVRLPEKPAASVNARTIGGKTSCQRGDAAGPVRRDDASGSVTYTFGQPGALFVLETVGAEIVIE
jgi:hypothetical protein